MRKYIEAFEVRGGDWVRAEVTDMSEGEKAAVQEKIEEVMTGKDYIEMEHNCNHDTNAVCTFTALN